MLLGFIWAGSLSACGSPPATSYRYSHPTSTPSNAPAALPVEGHREVGLASWYGPGFYGRKTASGARLNKKALTCAHRTLPFGTPLQVFNLENGKSVEVTVNDRGPFIPNKIVDLSYAAAKRIGMLGAGSAKVELRSPSLEGIKKSKEDFPEEAPVSEMERKPAADPSTAGSIEDLIQKNEKKE